MKQYTLLIGGEPVATSHHAPVANPSNGDVVGYMPLGSEADLDQAVAAAVKAFKTWSQVSDEERAKDPKGGCAEGGWASRCSGCRGASCG